MGSAADLPFFSRMKTFKEFILICEKLNKTHDEDSQSKLWNYFIANSENKKIRDLILSNDFEEAEKEIKKEVEKAKTDPEHPLNFKNAGDEEFSKKEGRQDSDEGTYNDFLDDSISGVMALSKQKKLRSAIEKGLPSRVTGSGQEELSKRFKTAGGTDKTPKGDLEVYDPDNPKYRVGVSMKKGAGAQLASAEGGELKGMYKIAARDYVRRFHSDKSKEERRAIEKEIMSDAERLSAIGRLQKTAGEAPNSDKQKQSLKNVSQGISDKLIDKYPQFERLLSQVATSGKGKFRGAGGTAGVVLTGKNKSKEASAKPAEQQPSAKPRLALPKGSGRPGNLKIDYRPQEPISRQSTFSDFSKKASTTQTQNANANINVQSQQTPANDPLTKERERISKLPAHRQAQALRNATIAHMRVQQANRQSQQLIQRQSQQRVQQPTQSKPRQTTQQSQLSTPQKVATPEDQRERRREMRQRMDTAGKERGLPAYG